jgi:hypothetical protein
VEEFSLSVVCTNVENTLPFSLHFRSVPPANNTGLKSVALDHLQLLGFHVCEIFLVPHFTSQVGS